MPVGVDVLSEQGYLAIALVHRAPHLVEHRGHGAREFPPPHIRHYAIGAEIVASVDDVHPRIGETRARDGSTLVEGEIVLRVLRIKCAVTLVGALFHRRARREHPVYLLRQRENVAGAEDDVHIRIAFFDELGHAALLRHAPNDRDDESGVFLLLPFHYADVAEGAALRVVPDAAGVENDDVRALLLAAGHSAHAFEEPRDLFGLVHVHLTAVCDDLILHLAFILCRRRRLPPAPVRARDTHICACVIFSVR